MRFFPVIALALCALPTVARAAPQCDLDAYVADPDPHGTNVRAAPNASAPILARLGTRTEEHEQFSAEVSIIGMSDGWAHISRAWFADYGHGEKTLFRGDGWISLKLIAFTVNAMELRAAPSADAPAVLKMWSAEGGWGPDSMTVSRIFECHADFAKLSVRTPDGHEATGWSDKLCGNQVTTCP
jgi:hypothetical protein